MGDLKKLETITKDVYDLLGSLKNARDSNDDPRTAIDLMTDSLKVLTNGIPNPKLKKIARDLLVEVNSVTKLAIDTIDRYSAALREAAGADGIPGFSPSVTPPPPGMEWQPTVVVAGGGTSFSQGPNRAVPIGDRLANDRPYYIDGSGVRIFPPPGGWADWGVPDTGSEFAGRAVPGIDRETNTKYRTAPAFRRDPLAIDLDGDGIETVGVTETPILFDHNADGIKTGTGWVRSDDGWLAMDLNNNGVIDTGRELFGVDTVLSGTPGLDAVYAETGFQALAALDTNADGVFNGTDAGFTQVRVWQDSNQDGVSQSNELFTLAQKDIASFGLSPNSVVTDLGNGNVVSGTTIVTRGNGTTTLAQTVGVALDTTIANLNLANNPFYREFSSATPLTPESRVLPEMRGSGWVRDLRQAMSLGTAQSAALVAKVTQFVQATTRDAQMALAGDLLRLWAETNQVQAMGPVDDPHRRFPHVDPVLAARLQAIVPVLEVFNGADVVDVGFPQPVTTTGDDGLPVLTYFITRDAASLLFEAYDVLTNSVIGALVVQTRLAQYIDSIDASITDAGANFNVSPLVALLEVNRVADQRTALLDLLDLNRYAAPWLTAAGFDGLQKLDMWVNELPPDSPLRVELAALDVYFGAATVVRGSDRACLFLGDDLENVFLGRWVDDMMYGGGGADVMYGGDGRDTLSGGDGGDRLYGERGDDILIGGVGSDSLYGGDGTNVYHFGYGLGEDHIDNNDATALFAYVPIQSIPVAAPGRETIVHGGQAITVQRNTDVLQFGTGIAPEDIRFDRDNFYGFRLILKPSGESITIENQFFSYKKSYVLGGTTYNVVERPWQLGYVKFADGTTWTNQQMMDVYYGGSADSDRIGADDDDNSLFGQGGDDWIDGGGGNDIVSGGDGADTLSGNGGDDTLNGGAGDDELRGDGDVDVYQFGYGSGNDRVINYDDSALFGFVPVASLPAPAPDIETIVDSGHAISVRRNTDVVQLAAGIMPAEVKLVRRDIDLQIVLLSTGETVTVARHFFMQTRTFAVGSAHYVVEERPNELGGVRFADGTTWGKTEFEAAGQIMIVDDSPYGGILYGGPNNDWLSGREYIDYLRGQGGSDSLDGHGGNDILYGDSGDDILDGGIGDDQLEGGDGADTYLFGRGAGIDSIRNNDGDALGVNVDTVQLGAGIAPSDISLGVSGTTLSVSINGNSDLLYVINYFDMDGTTSWTVENLRFADGTVWDYATVVSKLPAAAVTLTGTSSADTLLGWGGDDTLNGQGGNDTLISHGGNDTLNGGSGDDTMKGGVGNDTYVLDSTGDVVTELADEGTDLVRSSVTHSLGANVENLTLTGSSAINATGNALDNTLTGNAGVNVLTGGAGNDTYVVGTGDSVVEAAGSGVDTVQSATTWTLAAEVENLTLTGTSAASGTGNTLNNVLTGNSAANTLNGGAGADTLVGGLGNDTYVVDDATDVVTENAGEGTDLVQASISYTLSANVEKLTLTGTAAINGTGNVLANTLTGNSGNNVLDGGVGADTLVGGAGNDSYAVDNAADVATEAASAGTDTVLASLNWTLGTNLENLTLTGTANLNGTGNSVANVLTGNAGDNVLNGGTGTDTMVGGAGNDTYVLDVAADVVTEAANAGTDTVQIGVAYTLGANVENLTLTGSSAVNGTGNTLNNVLTGNSGNNTLTGAAGNDTLDGGAGADILVGGADNDTYKLGRGYGGDTIQENDATAGNSDVLQCLSGIAVDQLWFRKVSNNLEVSIIGTSDKATLTNWYLGSQYHVEQFKTSDGKTLLDSQVQNLVSAMAAFSPPAAGQTTLSAAYQTALNPVIAANWH